MNIDHTPQGKHLETMDNAIEKLESAISRALYRLAHSDVTAAQSILREAIGEDPIEDGHLGDDVLPFDTTEENISYYKGYEWAMEAGPFDRTSTLIKHAETVSDGKSDIMEAEFVVGAAAAQGDQKDNDTTRSDHIFDARLRDVNGGMSGPSSIGLFTDKEAAIEAASGHKDMGNNERGIVYRIGTGVGGDVEQIWPNE